MTGKMTLALTLDKADIDILKILNNGYQICSRGYDSIGCERIY